MTLTGSKKLALVLAGSLALNLFLLGAASMHFAHHHRTQAPHQRHLERPHHPAEWQRGAARPPEASRPRAAPRSEGPPHAPLLRKLVRAMGGPKDPRARARLVESRTTMQVLREEIRRAQAEVETALSTEPFDRVKLTEALQHLSTQTERAQKNAQRILVELATELTPEERATLRTGAAAAP